MQFYDDLIKEVIIDEQDPKNKTDVVGDIINVGLKPNYKDYDIFSLSFLWTKKRILCLPRYP